jgi:hypothetical protein
MIYATTKKDMLFNLETIKRRLDMLKLPPTTGQIILNKWHARKFKKKFKISYQAWINDDASIISEDEVVEWEASFGWNDECFEELFCHIKYAKWRGNRWKFTYRPETKEFRKEMFQRWRNATY